MGLLSILVREQGRRGEADGKAGGVTGTPCVAVAGVQDALGGVIMSCWSVEPGGVTFISGLGLLLPVSAAPWSACGSSDSKACV